MYAYFEATGLYPGEVAWLMTPWFYKGDLIDNCLSFTYNCYGVDKSLLRVFGKVKTNNMKYLWQSSRKKCPKRWLSMEFTISDFLSQIMFEATRGGATIEDHKGDLCIDDIHIKDGACEGVYLP